MCNTKRSGARMMRVSFEKGITGSVLNSLYSKSSGSMGLAAWDFIGYTVSCTRGVVMSLLMTPTSFQFLL
jgi:hypothetical protein